METHSLIVATTLILVGLILIQSFGFTIGLVKMHHDFTSTQERMEDRFLKVMREIQASIERMEKYRLVERK
jgi:hypothetical protein